MVYYNVSLTCYSSYDNTLIMVIAKIRERSDTIKFVKVSNRSGQTGCKQVNYKSPYSDHKLYSGCS